MKLFYRGSTPQPFLPAPLNTPGILRRAIHDPSVNFVYTFLLEGIAEKAPAAYETGMKWNPAPDRLFRQAALAPLLAAPRDNKA
jgi:hypothetical protein